MKTKPQTTPCDECGAPVDTDIHAEELGMCLECSNRYWNHEDEQEREPVEVVQLRATLAVINEIMGIQPKKESK